MPLTLSRQAERLQRALEDGEPLEPAVGTAGAVGGYAEVARRLAGVVPTTTVQLDPVYRAELHRRLVDLALAQGGSRSPDAEPVRARATSERPADGSTRPARTRRTPSGDLRQLRHRLLRPLAGLAAAAMTLVLGLGVASAGALPGGLLYPVKELVQSTQVHLASGGVDRSSVLLSQAHGHIKDAGTLVSQGSPDPADVSTALQAASSDLAQARGPLLSQQGAARAAALETLAAFATSESPVLTALRDRVPVPSVALVDALLSQVGQSATDIRNAVALCGSACDSVPVQTLPGPTGVATTSASTGSESGSASTGGLDGSGSSGLGGVGTLGGLLGTGSAAASGSGQGGGAQASAHGTDGASVQVGGGKVSLPGRVSTYPA